MGSVDLRAVGLRRGSVVLLDRVDLHVEHGELVAIIGPSGCGKTSVLRLVAGLERPTAGEVLVDGRPVDAPGRSGVAMVFEGDALYEHLDVRGNMAFPARSRGMDRDEAHRRAAVQAGELGLLSLLKERPSRLSGGQRGLTATGRALSHPDLAVLLLDEPLAKADPLVRRRFRVELRKIHDRRGLVTLLATSDQEEAMAVADRILVLDRGAVRQTGRPAELFEAPADTTVAGLLGSPPMNLIPAALRSRRGRWWLELGEDVLALDVDLGALGERRVVVGIHPHELKVAEPGTPFDRCLHAAVGRVEPLGATTLLHVGLGAAAPAYVARLEGSFAGSPGDRVELWWRPRRLRLFDPVSGGAL